MRNMVSYRGDDLNKKAVVLLSGGIDSSTTLSIVKKEGFELYALTFDYMWHELTILVAHIKQPRPYCEHRSGRRLSYINDNQ